MALRNSLDLARLADQLGYTRYWVAEHHNLPSIASSAPDIMIGQIAAVTSHIRVGSGGVMLPNHAPLRSPNVSRRSKRCFPAASISARPRAGHRPDHVDRAAPPPGDQRRMTISSNASRNCCCSNSTAFRTASVQQGARDAAGRAAAAALSVGFDRLQRASLSAQIGVGFAFAHHFASHDAVSAMTTYRHQFKPRLRCRSRTPFSRVAVVTAPTPTRRPSVSPPPSISISCAARAANICRSRVPKKPRPSPTRRSIASASVTTASGCLSARRRPYAHG